MSCFFVEVPPRPSPRRRLVGGRRTTSRVVIHSAVTFRREVRIELDSRIAASADPVERLDADRVEWTVAEALEEIVGPRDEERAAQGGEVASSASVQLDPFGRGRLYAELDGVPTTGA